ncbi:hypothetical protein QE394_003127 [Arthrobacter sp. SORGH_AS 212]|uniref:hypothetical protein n=1 Tax=Pseudarthrobacter sp. SORGH_AS 212 TaxID=3041777 RepID=UPI002787946C|nr:hypothetical protein [Arthrobacter sp. SORGH_AS_0212]
MPDDSYEAGYRAGHLQGWLDAMAKVAEGQATKSTTSPPERVQAQVQAPAPAPASAVPPTFAPPMVTASAPQPAPGLPSRAAARAQPVPVGAVAKPRPKPTTQPVPYRGYADAPPRPAESAEELAARRERRDRQNINVTLYVASLLLVAAAALFVGTALPPMMKFAGVCSVAALFYGSGFILHHRVPRLKPAAVAFTGTGLALVPVIGLALYSFVWQNGPAAWLATSLVGTLAYIAAALRLESRVLAYLSLTFLVSTAWSGMAVLDAALVWYFVMLIAVAVLFTLLSLARPGWLPPLFLRPLVTVHPVVVPAVAVAATFLVRTSLAEYALILGLSGAYFATMAAVSGASFRLRNFYAARVALTVAGTVAVLELTDTARGALLAAGVLLAVQAIGVTVGGGRLEAWFPSRRLEGEKEPLPSDVANPAPSDAWAPRWRADVMVTHVVHWALTAAFAGSTVLRSIAGAWVPDDGAVPLWVPVLLLLLTSFVLAARLRRAAEFLPFAGIALAGVVSRVMGEWEFALMVLLTAFFWLMRGLRESGIQRQILLFNTRIAGTVAVPAVTAALTEGRMQGQAVCFSVVAASVVQQLLSAWVQRGSRKEFASQATLIGFSVLGTVGVAVLAAVDSSPGHSLTWSGILLQLAAAVAMGLLLVPRPGGERPWSPRAGEVVPLVLASVMVEFAFRWITPDAGNIALAVVVAYLAVTGGRLRSRLHRWGYWWLCRIAATLLALTLFDRLVGSAGAPVVGGEAVDPATLLVAVLALQMAVVLVSFRLGRSPRGAAVDAGVVLAVQLIGCTMLWPLSEGSWQHLVIPGATALSSAAAGLLLRGQRGSGWFAPASFVVLVGLSAGNLTLIEVLLGIFAAFAAVMVAAAARAVEKGGYFIAARVLTAALAVVLSYDVSASPDLVSLTLAGVLAAQHVVRWLMRFRLQMVPFQQAAVWVTLAGQAALPLAYFSRFGAAGTGGERWILLVEFGLVLVSAVVARALFAARGALYFAVFAVLGGMLALSPLVAPAASPVLGYTGVALLLLALALAAAVAGVSWFRRMPVPSGTERWLWLAAALGYTLSALVLAPQADDWIAGFAVLVLAAVLFCASHVERAAVLYAPASAAVLVGTFMVVREAAGGNPDVWAAYAPWLGAGAAGAALYGVRVARSARLAADPLRRWSLAGAALAGLALATVAGLPADTTAWVAAAALAGAAAVGIAEAPAGLRRVAFEAGAVVVMAGVQRAAIFELDGRRSFGTGFPDPFWAAQWYVVLGAALAFLRYRSGQSKAGRGIAVAAAVLLSLTGAGTVFGGTAGQQLWLLVLLAVLLVGGLLAGEKIFVRWGAAGVAACILWAMRGYTFVLLALIAAGLIAFAVWRLNRSAGPEAAEPVRPSAPSAPSAPSDAGSDAPAGKVP